MCIPRRRTTGREESYDYTMDRWTDQVTNPTATEAALCEEVVEHSHLADL